MAGRRTATRAKDSDRDGACRFLDQALADGQLSMAEHRERIGAATRAVTLAELSDLLADLQPTDSAPAPVGEAGRSVAGTRDLVRAALLRLSVIGGRGIAIAAMVGVPLLGAGIAWTVAKKTGSLVNFGVNVPAGLGVAPDGVGAVVVAPPRQLHSVGGLTGLLEQMRTKFGDTTGYRLVVYPDYAVLERADPAEPRRELRYSFRGGWDGPTSSAADPKIEPVDLGGFDPKAAVGMLRGAPQTLGFKPGDITSSYLIVEPADDHSGGTVSLTAYVSSDYGGGYLKFAGDGTVLRVSYP